MYESGELKKGLKIEVNGEPHIIIQFEFVKPGKGKALYKCKLKNMITNIQFDKTFRSGDKIKEANIEEIQTEYIYSQDNTYCFMDLLNYEQIFLDEKQIEKTKYFLKENTKCTLSLFKKRVISVTLPNFVNLKVIQSDPWSKGDSAVGSTKSVKIETGLILQVPPFIDKNQKIKIDTRTGKYVEKVKKVE